MDIVYGRSQSSVPDGQELHRKREEDTLKCGRVTRSVGQSVTEYTLPLKIVNASGGKDCEKVVTGGRSSTSSKLPPNASPLATSTSK